MVVCGPPLLVPDEPAPPLLVLAALDKEEVRAASALSFPELSVIIILPPPLLGRSNRPAMLLLRENESSLPDVST